jgi:Tfp pilus assembly PilM family ATPase
MYTIPNHIHHAVGIDISDGSLELADINHTDAGGYTMQTYDRVVLPESTVVHGRIMDEQRLDQAFKELLTRARLQAENLSIVSALPDNQVIFHVMPLDMQQIPSYGHCERYARETMALYRTKVNDPVIRWELSHTDTQMFDLCVYMTSNDYVRQWKRFFDRHGCRLVALEMESLNLRRALLNALNRPDRIMIIDCGFRTTNIAVFSTEGLIHSYGIPRGGYHITKTLAATLHMSWDDANTRKESEGLSSKDPAVAGCIGNVLDDILTHSTILDLICSLKITGCIVTGGGSTMPGIVPYLRSHVSVPVEQGACWCLHHAHTRGITHRMEPNQQNIYAGALGLALRGADHESLQDGINLF